jgi:hypothetical protein
VQLVKHFSGIDNFRIGRQKAERLFITGRGIDDKNAVTFPDF